MFFTSHTHISECYGQWEKQGYFRFGEFEADLLDVKVFMEDRDQKASYGNYQAYCSYLSAPQPRNQKKQRVALFLLVSLDAFSYLIFDHKDASVNCHSARPPKARAIMIIGITYLLVNDFKVNLKKCWLEDKLLKALLKEFKEKPYLLTNKFGQNMSPQIIMDLAS